MEQFTKVFVEGGGCRNKALKTDLRAAFKAFFRDAGVTTFPKIIACGARNEAYKSFRLACHNEEYSMLLVDSEGPVKAEDAWSHLKATDGWERPSGAQDSQCHLMVQQMESWFVADIPNLKAYFGKGFNEKALPKVSDVEMVDRNDLMRKLKSATNKSQRGSYSKTSHQCEILESTDSGKVRKSSRHCEKLLVALGAQ